MGIVGITQLQSTKCWAVPNVGEWNDFYQIEEVRKKFGEIEGGGGVSDPAAISYENHTRNFQAFIKSLESGEDFWIDGREARKAVEVILAIYKSAKEEKAIKLT